MLTMVPVKRESTAWETVLCMAEEMSLENTGAMHWLSRILHVNTYPDARTRSCLRLDVLLVPAAAEQRCAVRLAIVVATEVC